MEAKINENEINFKMDSDLKFKLIVMVLLGVIAFVAGYILMGHTPPRHGEHSNPAWSALLVGVYFITGITMSGLFFTAISHITGSYWSITVRRVIESYSKFLPVLLVLLVVVAFFGMHDLYEWSHKEVVEQDDLLKHKSPFLNDTAFMIRTVLFASIWLIFGTFFYKNSTKQDTDDSLSYTHKNVKLSAIFLVVFALSFCVSSFDMLMSLTPHWFSTMFGIYSFSGAYQAGLASFVVILAILKKKGYLGNLVNENHIHDIGKFLLSFCIFWAYIGFSQFMLIWYANIPEETFWYEQRMVGGWFPFTIAMPILKFVVPFLLLLNRPNKRDLGYLKWVAIWILFMQFLELFWIVFPSNFETFNVFSLLLALGVTIGIVGLFGFFVFKGLESNKLIPINDPRLDDCLKHHQ
ncbi:MAG: hypothetical protein AAF518_09290 [Spirochaetota bacterium]